MSRERALTDLRSLAEAMQRESNAAQQAYVANEKIRADRAVALAKQICGREGVQWTGMIVGVTGQYDRSVAKNSYSEIVSVR